MRNQIKFVFQIGYEIQNAAFELDVARVASQQCGGCTTSTATGWWCEDGASHADTFKGDMAKEHCFQLELTCEQHKAERVYAAMQIGIAQAAQRNAVDTDWIHCSETELRGRHFSVQELLKTAA